MDPNNSSKRPAIPSSEWLVSIIPACLIMDILSRLPIKTLHIARCVCKTWDNIISDNYFPKLQITNAPPAIIIKTIRRQGETRQLQLAQIMGGNAISRFRVEKMRFNSEYQLPNCEVFVVNSCNGLLCLAGTILIADQIYICNPLMGEHITINLPGSSVAHSRYTRTFGFGFCAETNEYIVIQTHNIMRSSYEVLQNYQEAEIYTVGSGKWRKIANPPCMISSTLPVNALLNGSVHWINFDKDGYGRVYAFDFKDEVFREIPLPNVIAPNGGKCKRIMTVGELKGCLCLTLSFGKKSNVWIMKDYGVKKSWSKMFVVPNISLSKKQIKFCEPVLSFDNDEILMLCENRVLASYNLKTKKFRDAKICQTNGEFVLTSHVPSIVSIEDITEKEKVHLSRERARAEHQGYNYECVIM